ncbi:MULTISPECIES: thiolase family protein [Rhodococcus]|uniref:propanoyl-CoA C-acyltransferase n=1 Tax=Rhodococcus globerulus TaxID=33008 RepID=A0ABU4C457_RHOGO|nr:MULTISPECIES: thiolase family protein [Rhodococcus]MDV6271272.1 thiolase family protein [Rhodococcus globerulus]MDV8071446.1 thiolase family protein [Rhodococcus sp. IEGM 1366]NRI69792.1 thiolase family protein [Rhodococcus sp. MS16]QXW05207.1 thiolase family protein [Rhodococcus globerulus]RZL20938.1 MAG: thiolase family protein [Rhodococcus sp. (in: high G+C Gram-positive bacteria)]
MTEEVFVVSAAMIPFGKHRTSSYVGLAVAPLVDALRGAGIEKSDVDAVYVGHSFGGMMTGQRICKEIGLGTVPTVNVDNACSSGATAIHEAWTAISQGLVDVAVVVGVEKLTQFGGGTLPLSPEDREVKQGIVMPAVYAMRATRYLHETEATVEDLALVSVKARKHGALNPFAQFRSEVTVDEVLGARPIADPLTLMMCCPTGDGAAVVVLVSERARNRLNTPKGMRVAASILHSGEVKEGYRDMTMPEISQHSASDAYEMAGIGPKDLDMIELHDAFSIAELVYYEAFGLAERGRAIDLLRDGKTTFGGDVVVNPSGGLLSKGHPVGASGVAQVAEAFWQLTDNAGARQVDDARWAMTHVTGGGTAGLDHGACTIHIFEGV